ncbi:hypothetical protein KUV65_17515 [Maritalea mobilis]|uniref:hypothetical protein n=1 Tax=Maritalea mobilis TaxID=483324 RepID=UPI001C97D045|nr:hypothetical protein [Maritalea mobilis]MBY6203171.1 hypothetical protein [Maritalea mobilis]
MTLDEAMTYTADDMSTAYDYGIDASFRLMELATLPHPRRSTEMIPAELMARMLETPPDQMLYISTIREALAYDIQLSGVAVPTEGQLRPSHGDMLCENAIAAWEQRGGSRYESGLYSRQVFSFSAPYSHSIARAVHAANGERFPSGSYRIDTSRNGLYGAECGVMLGTDSAQVCVWDGRTGLRIGNCSSENGLWSESFPTWATLHPSTEISALGTQMAFDFEATQWTLCSLYEGVTERYWGPCHQAVTFSEFDGEGWMNHSITLPNLGTYEAFVQGERYEETAAAILSGDPAQRVNRSMEGLAFECLENPAGLRLCVFP